jgi:LPXTG-motif cell wall-anchored protein
MKLSFAHHVTYRFSTLLCVLALSLGIGLSSPLPAQAQTADDETYNCGTYGGGSFGSTDCVTAGETTPSVTPTLAPTSTPTSDGLFPDTGAGLGLWAAIGALLLAMGLGLYGYFHRRQRSSQ